MNATQQTANADEHLFSEDEEDSFSLTEILIFLGEQKKPLLIFACIGFVVSLLIAALLPKSFTASTVILPPLQQSSAAAAALAQLGALSGAAGAVSGVKTPDEMYVSLLKSRSVQDSLIQQLKLKDRYETETLEATRKIMGSKTVIASDKKSGFITVSAEDEDPKFAAELANAHVAELRKQLTKLALTDAQQRRMFFEQQVNKTKIALNNSEIRFRQAQAVSGLVVTQALAESGVKESAQLRGQIAAKQVQLQTISRFATSENPAVQRVAAEIAAMRSQLASIEQGDGDNSRRNNTHGTQAVEAFRDMKIQETILDTLIRQLEIARADEAKEGPLLQQIDVALPPEIPTKPKRAMIVIGVTLCSIVFGLLLVGLNLYMKKNTNGWVRIKQAWAGKKSQSFLPNGLLDPAEHVGTQER